MPHFSNDIQPRHNNHLVVKGVKSLILDIGGIILDDSNQALLQVWQLPSDEAKWLYELIYHTSAWREEIMTGKKKKEKYMHTLIDEHPKYTREIKLALAAEHFDQVLPLCEPNLDLVKKLHETGEYQMYWLSNMNDIEYEVLKQKGILDLLDGGIYSCDAHYRKPDPAIYRLLFERYDLEPTECVFFDDRTRNLDASEKLGMPTELVPNLSALTTILDKYF